MVDVASYTTMERHISATSVAYVGLLFHCPITVIRILTTGIGYFSAFTPLRFSSPHNRVARFYYLERELISVISRIGKCMVLKVQQISFNLHLCIGK